MFKILLLVKRKAGITREEFRQRYEAVHAPLAIKQMPLLQRYVRNYVESDTTDADFDCLTELWFESREVYEPWAAKSYPTGEVGRILIADEEQFMDRSSMRFLYVDERSSELPG